MIETHATSAYSYPLLIKHLLHRPLACNPNQQIVSGNSRYNYRTLRQRIGQLASGLAALGITRGSTVAVMDWDNHRYLECFFAVPMMGAVLHTINVRLSPEQIIYTINHAEDDVILVHEDFMPIIEQIEDRFERPMKLVFLQDESDTNSPDICEIEYEAMLAATDGDFDFQDFDENTPATTFYTTPITPMFHVHAWGVPYVATLMGVKQVYPGRYEPAALLGMIEREGVTFSHCVPTILHMMLTTPEADRVDLSGWKVIIGGSALSQGLAKSAVERGINVFAAYGMSETCPFLTAAELSGADEVSTDDETIARRCKTGQPTVLVDLRVVDSNMNDVPRDGTSTGEVAVRTPWLTQGYTGNAEGSEALWEGGYMHTGDVGYIDETGSLQITDRMKDIIKSGGEWISSLELEDIVSRCAGVSEVAAIGIEDERWGERLMLLITRSPEVTDMIDEEDILKVIRQRVDIGELSKWATPERIEFVSELPRTSVGKLDKKAMRATYGKNAR